MTITLVPYDPSWISKFENEKEKLLLLLGNIVVAIEHMGSTAIPDIHAKPVIDILIGVKDLKKMNDEHIQRIESLGYQYISAYEKELPFRRFFMKNDTHQNRTHHIHLVNYHSAWWPRHILFRDYLRRHTTAAKKYEKLKLKLAETLNASLPETDREKTFYKKHIQPYHRVKKEYERLREILGDNFTVGNQYALAKSELVQMINKKAYFDFKMHQPDIILNRLHGYVPHSCLF